VKPEETELEARMARLRQQAGPVAFDAGFADRVMARLERQPSWADGLQTVFLRLAPLAAAAVLVLGTVNLVNMRTSGQPFLDRVLELQPVNLAAAYSLEMEITVTKEAQP
jgi:hypothetical protein